MRLSNSLAAKFNIYTISAVYFLILVGGIVRSMGAGMGCPDWPKCFGSYIPPSDIENLPENYEEIYVDIRLEKNQRLASVLEGIGFTKLARKVANDQGIQQVTTYDNEKAWVEYVNRLVGVAIGLLIILNMIFSFTYRKENYWIPFLGVIGFILVVFQGWVGSLVVSTNLLPGFITFHMFLAILLVAILLAQQFLMRGRRRSYAFHSGWLYTLAVLFTLQVILGTQVREQVDLLNHSGMAKNLWVENLGLLFYVHRTFSLVIMGIVGWMYYKSFQFGKIPGLLVGLVLVLGTEIVLGIILAYLDMPAFAQPLHLFLGTVAFGLIFYLFLSTSFKRANA